MTGLLVAMTDPSRPTSAPIKEPYTKLSPSPTQKPSPLSTKIIASLAFAFESFLFFYLTHHGFPKTSQITSHPQAEFTLSFAPDALATLLRPG